MRSIITTLTLVAVVFGSILPVQAQEKQMLDLYQPTDGWVDISATNLLQWRIAFTDGLGAATIHVQSFEEDGVRRTYMVMRRLCENGETALSYTSNGLQMDCYGNPGAGPVVATWRKWTADLPPAAQALLEEEQQLREELKDIVDAAPESVAAD